MGLARFKYVNCDCGKCGGVDVPGRKVGKVFMCLQKYNAMKGQDQFDKQVKKQKQRGNLSRNSGKVRQLAATDENKEILGSKTSQDVELQRWFIHRSKEMVGKCYECGEKSCKGDLRYWKFSVCHILAKSLYPSVATHPLNFVELCHFGQSHHANMDNNGYEYVSQKMPRTWELIIERIKLMYPSIKEKSKIPEIILQELKIKNHEKEIFKTD